MNSISGPKSKDRWADARPTTFGDDGKGVNQTMLYWAFLKLLRSIARIAIGAGLNCKQVVELTKRAFTDVAFADFGIRQRDTNVARVAVITGLTRKEAKRLRDSRNSDEYFGTLPNTVSEMILAQWQADRAFCDSDGVPLPLRFDDGAASFKVLCAKYSGDIPPGAIRSELLRLGRLRVDENGMLHYVEDQEQDKMKRTIELIERFSLAAAATAHNVTHEADQAWPMVAVTSLPVRERDLSRVRLFSASQFAQTEKNTQDICKAFETIFSSSDGEIRSGIVMFHYETEQAQ